MPTPAPSTIEHDPRWARVLARDASADGQFVYAVKTTGVYCQPSSPSRLPRPENVEFFDTPAGEHAHIFCRRRPAVPAADHHHPRIAYARQRGAG
ncbi:Ada metal-binding domain-containing protein, partial [Ralstonia pseudosolanacearum]|uniref:Ada metal-binding domain-containing protein n=1 Tax=Ralstonia pseudosolanacearum TaxID=1310165 RepID=UPI003CF70AD9